MKQRIFLSPPHMEGHELGFVNTAFESNYIAPVGPMLNEFETRFSEYTGIPHCVAVISGTAALHLALKSLNIQRGDEIIASTLTFIGSISAALHMGASLSFIDSDANTWNMDVKLLEQEIISRSKKGKLPKAIIPTDLYGQCVDLDAISNICAPYGIPVIVDSAESVGAKYKNKHAGVGAYASIYSFNGNKIITCSGGGILASENKEIIDYARFLATQAREPFPYYEHKEVGFNYRLSNICAAIGCAQLQVLDKRVSQRRSIFEFYKQNLKDLPGIDFMPEAPYGVSNRWLSVIIVDSQKFGATPEDIRQVLEKENIESRPLWKPMHLQPALKNCHVVGGNVAEELFAKGLCLPSGSSMSEKDLQSVVDVIRSIN